VNKRSTDSTAKQAVPTREGKLDTDNAMTPFAPEEFAPEEFFGGAKFVTMNYCPKIPRMLISTAL